MRNKFIIFCFIILQCISCNSNIIKLSRLSVEGSALNENELKDTGRLIDNSYQTYLVFDAEEKCYIQIDFEKDISLKSFEIKANNNNLLNWQKYKRPRRILIHMTNKKIEFDLYDKFEKQTIEFQKHQKTNYLKIEFVNYYTKKSNFNSFNISEITINNLIKYSMFENYYNVKELNEYQIVNIGETSFFDTLIKSKNMDIYLDVNKYESVGNNPYKLAAKRGYVELVKDAVKRGFDVNELLHSAIYSGNDELIQFLIDNGADVNYIFEKNKFNGKENCLNLMYFATLNADIRTIKPLVENGAELNVLAGVYAEGTPLHIAAMKDYLEILKYLIDNGADVNKKNIHNATPLDVAKGRSKEYLLKIMKN